MKEIDLSKEIDVDDNIIDITYILELESVIIICKSGEIFKLKIENE